MGDIIWEVFILQIIMIIVLSAIVIYLLKTSKSIKYEKESVILLYHLLMIQNFHF